MSAGDDDSFQEDDLLRELASAPALSPPALPRPGDTFGRFRISHRLGSGASGVVFAATDVVLGREVAIKVLVLDPTRARKQVLLEARAAARISHPGVASLYDVIEQSGSLALVLERVSGSTLRELLQAHGPLSEQRAVELIHQAALAVAAAHAVGILHRDLKPENIMVTDSGLIKLLDFGLAAATGRTPCNPAGTRGYLAPEALLGNANEASDQYALGVIFIEALTGKRPSNAQLLTGLSPRLASIVRRALASSAYQRYPSVEAFAAALMAKRESTVPKALASLAVSALALISLSGDVGDTHRAFASSSPTVTPTRVERTACPPLFTSEADQRWLGAAAANILCKQARSLLGGSRGRAVPPAELLDLPASPSPDFPRDPFSAPEARERARTAAREHEPATTLVLDGTLARSGGMFEVTLRAERSGILVGRSEGRGTLAEASAQAIEELARDGVLPIAEAPDNADLGAAFTPLELAELSFAEAALATGGSLAEARRRLAPLRSRDADATLMDSLLAKGLGLRDTLAAPPVDETDASTLAKSATAHALMGGSSAPSSLAALIEERRFDNTLASTELELLRAEALLRMLAGERGPARALALAAALAAPLDAPWSVLAHTSFGRPEFKTVSRAQCAWSPEVADAWNIAAFVDTDESQRAAWLERAYLLSDGYPLYAGNYGTWLLIDGRLDEARGVIARLRVGSPGQRVAASRLLVELALAEGRVLGAYEEAWRALGELSTIGSIETGDIALVAQTVELGVLLGKGPQTAERLAIEFVFPDPPKLDPGAFSRQAIAHGCAYAERRVAERCFARLDELTQRGYFPIQDTGDAAAYVEGARAFAAGDLEVSGAAFRRVQSELGAKASVAALVLAQLGDIERADAMDPPRPGTIGGISLSHLRAAKRAFSAHNCDRARPLAEQALRALRNVDVEFEAMEDMRKIVRECKAPSSPNSD